MKAVRKPHGHVERTGPYGELQTGDTLSCCHCGCHWEVRAGSGVQRGFCQQCMGYVCGGPDCHDCLPKEARLANLEAGRPLLTPLAPKVLVPGLVGGVDARQAVDRVPPGLGLNQLQDARQGADVQPLVVLGQEVHRDVAEFALGQTPQRLGPRQQLIGSA